MSGFLLKIRRGETPFYSALRKTAQAVMKANLPVPGFLSPLFSFVYRVHFAIVEFVQGAITFFYREPIFRARCASVGPHLRLSRLPEIYGHTKIHLGEDVSFTGVASFMSGRFLDQPTLIIKDRTTIGHHVSFSVNQEVIVEEDVIIANHCTIADNDGHPRTMDLRIKNAPLTARDIRPVRIGRGAWLGRGVQVMKGVTIGEGAVISANSIVFTDIPAYALAMGNPAEVMMLGASKPKTAEAAPVEPASKPLEKMAATNGTDHSVKTAVTGSPVLATSNVKITRAAVLQEIGTVLTRFDSSQAATRFEDLGLDSFDMVTLRSLLEQKLNRSIPTHVWIQLATVNDILDYYADEPQARPAAARQEKKAGAEATRQLRINMPQMAIGGLSESWLFKELGDIHWEGICQGLGTESHAISDDANNRLYATFVRFRWEGTDHLKSFRENETIRIGGRLSRYGKSMFLSNTEIEGADKSVRASLMSAFASRQGGNESLMKGEPLIPADCPVPALDTMPLFLQEYRQFRKRERQGIELNGETLSVAPDALDEVAYSINPYHDLNGVNLLYFAAYPAIADICEREFVHRNSERLGLKSDWALETSTIARDILYFGNCAINEKLLFRIHMFQAQKGGKATVAATLSRSSDGHLLCCAFTVKRWHG